MSREREAVDGAFGRDADAVAAGVGVVEKGLKRRRGAKDCADLCAYS